MNDNALNSHTAALATIQLYAMGCHIELSLDMTRLSQLYLPAAIEHQLDCLKNTIQGQLAHWERIFSRFDDHSELMRLNTHTNQWTSVSAELFAVLQRAMHFVPRTQGLVTPTLLKPLWDAGYQYSFETLTKHSTLSTPSKPNTNKSNATKSNATKSNANPQIERIKLRQLTDERYDVYLPKGMALDLNGYVKGWCASQLAEQMSKAHDWHIPCLVDMGGDIAIGVPSATGHNPIVWGIAIAKPYGTDTPHAYANEQGDSKQRDNKHGDVAILAIQSGGVATSGQDYRRWWHNGKWQHHLIHPHHGQPAISDVMSATVLATDTLTAEVYAKYCVLLGVAQATLWLAHHNIAAVLIDTDNKVWVSAAMHSNLAQPNLLVV